MLEYTNLVCNVSPFVKRYEHKENVPMGKASTSCNDGKTGTTYIFVLG